MSKLSKRQLHNVIDSHILELRERGLELTFKLPINMHKMGRKRLSQIADGLSMLKASLDVKDKQATFVLEELQDEEIGPGVHLPGGQFVPDTLLMRMHYTQVVSESYDTLKGMDYEVSFIENTYIGMPFLGINSLQFDALVYLALLAQTTVRQARL